ncbi:MAG: YbaN family protein [Novosphingobium sp.]|nr:YbaN family protein [Novosphingobium sp.]
MSRTLFLVLGLLFVALAIVGAFLPILPTVPFLLVAAFCFARSRPEWAQRLYDHPQYGSQLREWRDRQAIGRKAKYASIGAMSAGVVFTWFTIGWPWVLISVSVLVIVGPWIWTRPE